LEVQRVRRGVERLSASRGDELGTSQAVTTPDLTRELEELIAALDRRVPRLEQAGEVLIARDAASLRAEAVERLAELVRNRGRTPTSPP
jgi:hypothetical protein